MQQKYINTDWETSKPPKSPKKIRVKGIRGLLGVISPSKTQYYAAAADNISHHTNAGRDQRKHDTGKCRI